ncbi:MAG: 3-deoxy-manno-octulosonate cytidylyltransferase [Bacteroidales bacterium]|jgi:3-deoxy-manno-octulosonate cytidylyltransferase (CMP-KDO synthetase)|nr:3-deoxy-manno-octulosonate cytidylyltransferase [Bacteroidales bacterium]
MKILAIIPARYASTRFPGKPLALIGGVTMIERVYARSSEVFESVYVATDDKRIYDSVTKSGGNAVMTSVEHPNGTSRVLEAMYIIEKVTGEICDVVVNIQGDEPFIEPLQLKELISCFDNPGTMIATLAKKIDDKEELFNPNTPKVVFGTDGNALYFSRSPIPFIRDVPPEEWIRKFDFFKHIGLYGYTREALIKINKLNQGSLEKAESLEQLRWLENGIKIVVQKTVHSSYSVDIPDDIEFLKAKGLM